MGFSLSIIGEGMYSAESPIARIRCLTKRVKSKVDSERRGIKVVRGNHPLFNRYKRRYEHKNDANRLLDILNQHRIQNAS